MKRRDGLIFCYIACLCLLVGGITGLYLQVVNWLLEFCWKFLPQVTGISESIWPWVFCLPMGIVIGYLQRYFGRYPLTIQQVLQTVRLKGYFDYRNWKRTVISGLIILAAGASVGPEASATGILAGMIYWIGCRFKLAKLLVSQAPGETWHRQVRQVISQRIVDHQVKLRAQPITAYFKSDFQRKVCYGVWTLFGLAGLLGFFKFFPQEGVIGFHLAPLKWQWQGWYVVPLAVIFGWLFGWLFVKVGKLAEKWLDKIEYPIFEGLMGVVLLATGTLVTKDVLFSGEFSIQTFAHDALTMPLSYLIIFAIIKTFMTNVGFALGWRGGTIFPAIFASLSVGAAVAQVVGWMPQLVATMTVAVALTVILERPLVVIICLALIFPLQFIPFVVLISLLIHYGLQRWLCLRP